MEIGGYIILKLPKLIVVNDGGISQLNQNFKVQNLVKKNM